MPRRPGTPKTGGRKAGTPNKRTVAKAEVERTVAERLAEVLGPDQFDGDALALMTAIYRNTALPLDFRLEAAKAAAPYERPRLAQSNVTVRQIESLREVSDGELAALAGAAGAGPAADRPVRSGYVQ